MFALHSPPPMTMPRAMSRPLFVLAIFLVRPRSRFPVGNGLLSKFCRHAFDLECQRPFHLEKFAALIS